MPTEQQPGHPSDDDIYRSFRLQRKGCKALGSPLNTLLMDIVSQDFKAGNISAQIVADWQGDPMSGLLGLRVMGGVHYAIIKGVANTLGEFYPSVGGVFCEDGFAAALVDSLSNNRQLMRDFIIGPPQTNEVRRTGVLIGGFLTIAKETGLPLRCLEVGASAGLNLNWPQFAYEFGDMGWNRRDGNPSIPSDWTGTLPDTSIKLQVAGTRGCDINPPDISDPDTHNRMRAYVWADQLDRVDRFEAASALALANHTLPDRADAADWTREQLATLPAGQATVLYHSIARQYFDDTTDSAFVGAIEEAGRRATNDRPLAWLQMEVEGDALLPILRLKIWPSGLDRVLCQCHPHGNFAEWY